MAKAEHQRAWRQRSGKKPIQCYLDVETISRLDALAAERGQSRAAVLAQLIDAAAPAAGAAPARDPDTPDMFDASTGDGQGDTATGEAEAQAQAPQGGTSKIDVPTHKLRKAQGQAPDGSDAWAIHVDGGRVGLVYRNTNPNEQRAAAVRWVAVADRTATRKPYKYRTRTQAVEMMLKVERPHERGRRS